MNEEYNEEKLEQEMKFRLFWMDAMKEKREWEEEIERDRKRKEDKARKEKKRKK